MNKKNNSNFQKAPPGKRETSSIDAYDLPTRVISYDADMDIMHPRRIKMVEIALEVLPLEPASHFTAVELGVGTGFFTGKFLEKYPYAKVIGIDGASSMVDLARERLGPSAGRVDFKIGDFQELGQLISPHEKAGVIFSSYALHHLNREEKTNVVRQASAFLEPWGWFLNADLIIAESPDMEERIQQIRVEGILRRAKGEDKRFKDFDSTRKFLDELEANEGDQPLTLKEDLQILKDAGLSNISVFWLEYREVVYGGTT